MELNVNIWVGLSLFGFAQGIFLSFVLFFHKRGNQNANKILAILIFLFSLRLGEFVAYWTSFFNSFPHLLYTTSSFQFLFGVLLYFYAKTIIDKQFTFKKIYLLHLLPFVLQVILFIPFYLQSAQYKIDIFNQVILTDSPDFSVNFFILRSVQYMHMLVYSITTLLLIKNYNPQLKNGELALEKINLKWLKNLTIGFLVFICLSLIHSNLQPKH